MIKNNKGFVVTEVLILSTVLIGLLVFMFIQFKNINRSYQYSFKYDTVGGMYLANNIVNYIGESDFDTLVQHLSNSQDKYLDITDCNINYFSVSSFCEEIITDSRIEKILFTYENTSLMNKSDLDEDIKLYINNIQTQLSNTDYRIIIKYLDGTYASMRFNKGDVYVQKGLIAYLDGIDNTGYGHSSDTDTWKDLSGNGNDATLYNNPVWSSNSISFDGVSNYGRLENTANITYQNGVTIETRVKIISETGKVSGKMSLMGNLNNAGLGIDYYDTNVFKPSIYTNELKTLNNTTTSNEHDFYTITLTYDNQIETLYINGIQVASATYTPSANIISSIVPFGIGGNSNVSSVSNYSNVEFEKVLIYDRALTPNEVSRNYQVDMVRY